MNIFAHQESQYAQLRSDLEHMPEDFSMLPFHDYIHANTPIHSIKAATERMLWHQRLGHPSDHYLYNAHKYIDGVPNFKHHDPILERCPTCIQAKQRKEPAGPHSTKTATRAYQGLSVDFAFSGTKSRNSAHNRDILGLNGETCYILIVDHHSGRYHGSTRVSKATPLKWIESFLTQHSPDCPDKYVYLDQGGELYRNPAVRRLFTRYNYTVRPTGADSSNQNGPVERAHLTLGNGIRSLLHGAGLSPQFWPYAFAHYLRIKNAIPSREQDISPIEATTGKREDFAALRTFGCRVWVRPTTKRPGKYVVHSRKGIFLGYLPDTTKNIVWYDIETQVVKIAKHAQFDEGMNDLPIESIPPNVQYLLRSLDGQRFPSESSNTTLDNFTFTDQPFTRTIDKSFKIRCSHPTFGLTLTNDELFNRAYVQAIHRNSTIAKGFSTLKAANNKIRGAYITSINHHPVFTVEEAQSLLALARDSSDRDLHISFAPERAPTAALLRKALVEHDLYHPDHPDDDHTPVFRLEDIRHIAALRHPEYDFSPEALASEHVHLHINAISSHTITPEEHALGTLTRRKLKTLSTWDEWHAAEHKQLDQMASLVMFGTPCPPPPGAIILRPHWQYQIRRNGQRRARNCCDGSRRSAPALHAIAATYSSCVEQPVQRLFYALAARLGYRTYGGDAQDAFAHSPGPKIPTYVYIDDAYADWYFARFGTHLDRRLVLPVLRALQGHPESGRLWEEHINKILSSDELQFRHTTLDHTIYSTVYKGQKVLMLRQVDDFSIACDDESIAIEIYDIIGRKLQLPGEDKPPFKYLGLQTDYNGLDIEQTSTHIAISCSTYISRFLTTHGWDTPGAHESDTEHDATPLPPDAVDKMYDEPPGPPEGSPEHQALQDSQKFPYRTVLGELLYAYVTARPDIGYHITTLSKFASSPSALHYHYLKCIAKYLRRTIHWKLYFKKPLVDDTLPTVAIPSYNVASDLPVFPQIDPDQLTAFVDAAYANDKRNRRSTTGYAFTLAGATIAYRSKTQSTTATSSTEAEFLAAVTTAKAAKYFRSILLDLGFPQHMPTPIYEDNMSAIKMINARIPTERSRHVDIQHFAIQDWKDAGDIVLCHIPGSINPSDDLTKPLGWVLHQRHARRLMGHHDLVLPSSSSVLSCNSKSKDLKSGEGVSTTTDDVQTILVHQHS
ncbi:reverse transcriptase RNA-dependent DNA polymerase [Nitzschia inconspicua]|uniref:Reverse transcriptase RNA-dependent DNA polymerase n=1 Tax=Nitzschia inconspicua TaxID=303405 RepID=A0A9K3Q9I5_9STRA|nr:reverse transcriptase RNA-dependent DNA polymerase [Nitzschia inconspicua]